MPLFAATESLTNYINNNNGTCKSQSSASSISIEHNNINQQLNDLKLQFENGIKNLQYNKPSISLKPSLSMPQLPMFSTRNFDDSHSERKTNKKRRKKPRTLISSKISTPYDSSTSVSPTPSSPSYAAKSSISAVQPTPIHQPMIYQPPTAMNNNGIHQNIDNTQINHKLDLLINIIHSQQKLLENLVIKTNKNEEDKREKKKRKTLLLADKGIQTMDIPRYIIQSEQDSKQQSPFTKYPPIPEPHSKDSNSIPVPYETLLKLVSAVTAGHKLPQYSSYPPPQIPSNQQPIPMRYDNNNNHQHHRNSGYAMNNNPNVAMSPKSTLHFSDC